MCQLTTSARFDLSIQMLLEFLADSNPVANATVLQAYTKLDSFIFSKSLTLSL